MVFRVFNVIRMLECISGWFCKELVSDDPRDDSHNKVVFALFFVPWP